MGMPLHVIKHDQFLSLWSVPYHMDSHHIRFCQIAPLCNTDYVVVDKMQCAIIEILGNPDYVCNFSKNLQWFFCSGLHFLICMYV